jgi:hypothetical protein
MAKTKEIEIDELAQGPFCAGHEATKIFYIFYLFFLTIVTIIIWYQSKREGLQNGGRDEHINN